MIKSGVKCLINAGLAAGFAAAAAAEDLDIGKSEFQSSCASCHGTGAKGKGPVSEQLKVPPSDLTMLAKNNNGVFPTNAVYETLYGSKTIPAHGTREMPIWGERYRTPSSTCLTMLIRFIGSWRDRSKARKSSCVCKSSPLSTISIVFSKSDDRGYRLD